MYTLVVTSLVLTLLYALAWHNQPAKKNERTQTHQKPEEKPGAAKKG